MKEVAAKIGERAGPPQTSRLWPRAGPLGAAGLHAVFGGAVGARLLQQEGGQRGQGGRAHDGAVVAISTLRLSAHPGFPRPRRPCDEPRASVSSVATGEAAGAAQARTQT